MIPLLTNWATAGIALVSCALSLGVCILIDILVSKQRSKKTKKSDKLQFSQEVYLQGQATIETLHSMVVVKRDIIDVPGSLIGKYVEINKYTKTGVGEGKVESLATGIILSENATVIDKEDLAIHLSIFNSKDKVVSVTIPVEKKVLEQYQVCRPDCGDMVKQTGANIIKDIVNFCQNQCIFDCKNCVLSKYGIRKTTGEES